MEAAEPMRIDRWLWAARFVKTRPLATVLVNGGRVALNGKRVKPGKEVRAGDQLEITVGQVRYEVKVIATAPRRLPAKEAVKLYEETAESVAERERRAAEAKLARPLGTATGPRPTKRDRRRLEAARSRVRKGR